MHDETLIEFEWKDDGTPCLALVLSAWFTRGWTALELYVSDKVVVLFKNPNSTGGKPLLKDLDKDIIAQDIVYAHPAHWLASLLSRGCVVESGMNYLIFTVCSRFCNPEPLLGPETA